MYDSYVWAVMLRRMNRLIHQQQMELPRNPTQTQRDVMNLISPDSRVANNQIAKILGARNHGDIHPNKPKRNRRINEGG